MKRIVRIVFFLLVMIITGSTAIAGSNNEYETARKYFYSGRYSEAVKHLKDYTAQKPDASASYMMGYSLYKLKRFDEANEYFQDAYLLDPAFSPIKEAGTGDQPKRTLKKRPKTSGPAAAAALPVAKQPSGASVGKQPTELQPTAQAAVKTSDAPKPDQGKPEPAKPVAPAAGPAKPAEPATQSSKTQPQAPQTGASGVASKQPAPPSTTVVPQPPVPLRAVPKSGPAMPAGGGALVAIPMLMGGLFAGFTLVFFGILIAFYVFFSLCMYLIARKLNVEAAWTAWIPLLNLWAFVGSAGKPWWWILLLFIPFINFFVSIYLWMCIVENLGKNKWLGLLMLVPLVNLVFMAILAFSKDTVPAAPIREELE